MCFFKTGIFSQRFFPAIQPISRGPVSLFLPETALGSASDITRNSVRIEGQVQGLNYGDKIQKKQFREIWDEYCNFLDLSIDEYMTIQRRLMQEQIQLWSPSGIGRKFLDRTPESIEDFRNAMPLTTYEDYADILLGKKEDMMPMQPVLWLQTTWEGGKHPLKVAPYTQGMLDTFRGNLMSVSTLSSVDEHQKTKLRNGDRVLFGLAPLPFVTGLFPLVFEEEIDFRFLPPVKEANKMSFGERNRKGCAAAPGRACPPL